MTDTYEVTAVSVLKLDPDRRLVFGIFNIAAIDGKLVVDAQGEVIEPATLETAVYKFVLKARIAGREHQELEVGTLVESVFFSKEKQAAMQAALTSAGIEGTINANAEFWWGGFFIESDLVWKKIKNGEFPAFSIGGMATRENLE